ncbi:MAG: hypothetical protein R3B60_04900 [Candidatus Paceibacterota bacterium]
MASEAESDSVSKRIIVMVVVTALSVSLVLLTAYTKYIYAHDYDFIIEAPCDPEQMSCYVRDCNDYCPPNELEIYQVYHLPASIYPLCIDNSCTNICESDETKKQCIPVLCNINNDDDCTS